MGILKRGVVKLMTIEKRIQATDIECRTDEETKAMTITGYAVRYDEPSEPLEYGFREVIKPNAFTESLNSRNIVALHQHDSKELLASTKAKTLRLEERSDGVYFEMDLLPSRNDLYDLVKRGDLSNMSFGFTCEKEKFTRSGDTDIREVLKGTLFECSLVHTPAYQTTSAVAQRSLDKYEEFKGEDKMTKQEDNKQEEGTLGIDVMTRQAELKPEEIRTYSRGEKMGTDEDTPSLGALIRSYVTGEGTEEEKRMITSSTNGGNFLVPHKVMSNFLDLARDKSFLFQSATTVNMGNNQSVSIPRVLSDPSAAFKKQGEDIEASDATFSEFKLEAKYMYGLVEVPLELVKTGVGVEQKLNHLLATALNQTLEDAALNGAANGFEGIFNDDEIIKETIDEVNYEAIKKGAKVIATNNHQAKDLVLSTNNQLDIETATATDGQFITPPSFYTNLSKHATNKLDDEQLLLGDLASVYVGILQNATMDISTSFGFGRGTLAIRIMWYGDVAVSEPKQLALLTVGE